MRTASRLQQQLVLLRSDPGFVERARAPGNEVHVWTVNHPDDIR